jgi:hypothetical protein
MIFFLSLCGTLCLLLALALLLEGRKTTRWRHKGIDAFWSPTGIAIQGLGCLGAAGVLCLPHDYPKNLSWIAAIATLILSSVIAMIYDRLRFPR